MSDITFADFNDGTVDGVVAVVGVVADSAVAACSKRCLDAVSFP